MDGMRLDIEQPLNGWVKIRLTARGVRLEFDASYTPWDSIDVLARATAGLLAGVPQHVVVWNTEPVEYEFRFAAEGDRTRLEVHKYPDRRRRQRRGEVPVAVVEGDTIGSARAIWRGLRRLQGTVSKEEFAAAWGYPFPASTVERIGEQLQRHAHSSTRSTPGISNTKSGPYASDGV